MKSPGGVRFIETEGAEQAEWPWMFNKDRVFLGMMEDSGDGWLYSSVNELNTVRKQDTVGPSWDKHPTPSPPSSLCAEKH